MSSIKACHRCLHFYLIHVSSEDECLYSLMYFFASRRFLTCQSFSPPSTFAPCEPVECGDAQIIKLIANVYRLCKSWSHLRPKSSRIGNTVTEWLLRFVLHGTKASSVMISATVNAVGAIVVAVVVVIHAVAISTWMNELIVTFGWWKHTRGQVKVYECTYFCRYWGQQFWVMCEYIWVCVRNGLRGSMYAWV